MTSRITKVELNKINKDIRTLVKKRNKAQILNINFYGGIQMCKDCINSKPFMNPKMVYCNRLDMVVRLESTCEYFKEKECMHEEENGKTADKA